MFVFKQYVGENSDCINRAALLVLSTTEWVHYNDLTRSLYNQSPIMTKNIAIESIQLFFVDDEPAPYITIC